MNFDWDRLLEPPDDEPDNYDDWFGDMSDLEYERFKEDTALGYK